MNRPAFPRFMIGYVIGFLLVVAYNFGAFQPSDAGQYKLVRVVTQTSGILSGSGYTTNPLIATLSKDSTLTGTGSAGSPLALATVSQGEWYGSGKDGACAFDGSATVLGLVPSGGVYTMTRDIWCTTLALTGNGKLKCRGATSACYRVYANTSITFGSSVTTCTIEGNGNDAVGATGGAAADASGSLAGGSGAGATGGTGVGATATSGTAGTPTWYAGGGGAGGAGVSAGGAGGTTGSALTATQGDLRFLANAVQWAAIGASGRTAACSTRCAVGGGAGGGGGVAGQTGGGGGGGGKLVQVVAPVFTGTGSICSKGGNGGNGANAANATGGGGGGMGGPIVIVYDRGTAPTTDVSGGIKGAHGSGGGSDGADGDLGAVRLFRTGKL